MRGRFHHRRPAPPELDITAFMNLMVILVPFLLITAVFSHIGVLELNIPPAVENSENPDEELQLEIIIRKDALEVADRRGGLIRRVNNDGDRYDYKALSETLTQVKTRFPDKLDATIMAEQDTPYEILIAVMDATRTVDVVQAGNMVQAELFPELSIGDAPSAAGSPP